MIPFDVIILGTEKKPILTLDYVQGLNYKVYYNKDWDLPNYTRSKLGRVIPNVKKHEPGPYRCFRGHQEALKLAETDMILMLEDDAVPNVKCWHKVVKDSAKLLDRYDVVSLHVRSAKKNKIVWDRFFKHRRRKYGIVGYITRRDLITKEQRKLKWALGSLAYLTTKKFAKKISRSKYKGVPMDLFIANCTNSCMLVNSCFDHDRKHGSLVQNRKNVR